mgnify:CR=1 FL=1
MGVPQVDSWETAGAGQAPLWVAAAGTHSQSQGGGAAAAAGGSMRRSVLVLRGLPASDLRREGGREGGRRRVDLMGVSTVSGWIV